jgi:hypothetical protein
MYVIRGDLTSPNGRTLRVRSYWLIETATGRVKLITMFPDKERGDEIRDVSADRVST